MILLCFSRMEKFSISIFWKDDLCAVYHCGVAQENLLCKWQALMAKEQYFGMLFMLSWGGSHGFVEFRFENSQQPRFCRPHKTNLTPKKVYHSKWMVLWAWQLATHVWHWRPTALSIEDDRFSTSSFISGLFIFLRKSFKTFIILLVMGGTVQLCFWCSGKHSAIVQKKVFLRLWIKRELPNQIALNRPNCFRFCWWYQGEQMKAPKLEANPQLAQKHKTTNLAYGVDQGYGGVDQAYGSRFRCSAYLKSQEWTEGTTLQSNSLQRVNQQTGDFQWGFPMAVCNSQVSLSELHLPIFQIRFGFEKWNALRTIGRLICGCQNSEHTLSLWFGFDHSNHSIFSWMQTRILQVLEFHTHCTILRHCCNYGDL